MAKWYQDTMWWILKNTKGKKLVESCNIEVVSHQEEPEPPFILMGNHAHAQDPYMIGHFMNHTVNYMANIDGVSDIQRRLSNLVGAYGKKKGASDFAALKQTINLLKNGNAIGIFPEGDRSWDGSTVDFIPGTASIAKRYKVPIRIAKMTGAYLTEPRWADYPRRGRVLIDFRTITVEEIALMSATELEKKICSMLKHNDIKDPLNNEIVFTGENLASGIQRIIWFCPECGAQDSINGSGDKIICSVCGKNWQLDGNLRISPTGRAGADLKDWIDMQADEMKKICESAGDAVLTRTDDITLSEVIDRKMTTPRNGNLVLYRDRIEFSYENSGMLVFDNIQVEHYIDNFNKAFEFDYGKKRYRVIFDGKNASKWIFFLNYLKAI
ncbi:MAG: lysophospholipid acyltransferase family protein [Spirochaetales bacterium]|uniref:Lysophospholipid acyltransferase family protein n=1 Tax=Candidatus Thalassospirochaeta sargassi TaxID=3119039 RepID=A0AAJ1ICT2_9SPIO|nr:lysophospholipid acyltransferase family protein [Spirochaetales bacterium]